MEIERKFLINSLPDNVLSSCECAEIEQSYLDFGDGEEPERRIRKTVQNGEAKYFYTEKGKGDLSREEEEYEISEYSYNGLSDLVISPIIHKKRYYFSLSDTLIAEIDVYLGELDGLITVEIEFPDLQIAQEFKAPDWFGDEVTYDKRYKNKNLAISISNKQSK